MLRSAKPLDDAGDCLDEPHRRLMVAVLQTVLDDCRGTAHRQSRGNGGLDRHGVSQAIAYVASTDRAWPFSFENLCAALDLDAGRLRRELGKVPPA